MPINWSLIDPIGVIDPIDPIDLPSPVYLIQTVYVSIAEDTIEILQFPPDL